MAPQGQAGTSNDASTTLQEPAETTLVGRDRELAEIERGLTDALAGRGRFFLLLGEPGIGKTRLCDEVSAAAARRGLPVLWGRAWEAGGAPAYWPWMDVLTGLAQHLDDEALRLALGDGAQLVAEFVPEIRARLPDLPEVAPPPPNEARFRLCRTVVALVRRVADPTGLVLVFDDLHSTDRSSLLLLYALARELRSQRVLLMATCRDVEARLDPEAGELISRLGREGVVLALPRLNRSATDTLVRRRAGVLASELSTRIFESTQGNPLFLEEMLRLFDEQGHDAIAAGVVPSGVRDVIRQRLDRVPADARDLLDLAAVAGDEIQSALLARACGRDDGWIALKIADATRAGVFARRAERTRFSHALVREVLYRDLAPDLRRTLHAAVGTALQALHAHHADPPFMELAHHALAGPADGLPVAVEFAVRAARRAVDLTAPEEAVAVLARAADAVDTHGGPSALRARVLLALGETNIRRGEVVVGKAQCCEVATLARSLGDATLLAEAALTYGRVFIFAVVDPVMVQLLEDALSAQPPGDSTLRARLLARLAGALQPAINAEEPVRLAYQAIAIARRLNDRRALLETIHDGLSALMDIVGPADRLTLNLEVEALALAERDRERLLRTHARLAVDYLALGDFANADARIDACEALAKELRASWMLWRAPLFRAMRANIHGRFAEAERLEEEARLLARDLHDPQTERALLFQREGRMRTAERHQDMLVLDPLTRAERGSFHNGGAWRGVGSALVFTRLEDERMARFHLESVTEDWLPPSDNLFALFFVVESAAFVGSDSLTEKLYRQLYPWGDIYIMLGMTHLQWEGPVARLLGLLAARLRRWDQATLHFEDAVMRLRRLDARPHLARVEYEFARALLARGRGEDAGRARHLLLETKALAAELDLPALGAQAEARLFALDDAAQATPRAESSAPPVPAVPPPGRSSEGDPFTMVLEGEFWTVTTFTGGRAFRLRDSLGLRYLARLLAQPGQEIHVLDLVGAEREAPGQEEALDTGDAGELLDEKTRSDYRRRLDDLRETLVESESFGDTARTARARAEIEFIGVELARAIGLGGRIRRAGSAAERARSAVQRRIKNAISRIVEAVPELATVLNRCIRTGNFCEYRPDKSPGDQRRS